MDNKKIIDMKYTVDENGKPVSATVIYDDNTYKNVVNDPSQVIEWATQVAREIFDTSCAELLLKMH